MPESSISNGASFITSRSAIIYFGVVHLIVAFVPSNSVGDPAEAYPSMEGAVPAIP